jgi:dTDP-4-amino-4,6-dideoxygalactose transaminase
MKQTLDDLAVLGGTPAFIEALHVGRPNIGNRDRLFERINDLLDRRWLTNNGPYVQELEHRIAELAQVKHCVAFCNGTIALEVAIRATGMVGEVIVPSFTFIATPHALQWQEITPVFCDVAPGSHHLDPARVEEMLTPRTTGIIGVHVWGKPCDVETLQEIASRHNLKLLFDAAHAFGCTHQGRMIGSFGDAEVFSFHATKFFNTFEGGAVTTSDDELADKMRYMRNFGFAGYDNVEYIGINGKMNEVSAAMGLTSLESMDSFIAINRQHYEHYLEELSNVDGLRLVTYDKREKNNYQYMILEVDPAITHISRDTLVQILHAEGILARRYFYPGCHEMEPYRSYFPHAHLLLPRTIQLTTRVMSVPTGTALNSEDVQSVCNLVRFSIAHGEEIEARLGREAVQQGLIVD